ncbi:nucleoside-diphosphate sugar epimerase [Streptomyces venezuelae]|uniref:Nucleoside-diphosphate sugar epimerase n=1 Tax=Streptomyces venezuelae TaxID=54571 RepID=A0A5P2DA92_STRVZ|nr:NAD(P)H-binding protein [Streptomyces venezuelae]QES51127.1 nucleoside-diphosphate sugar epimerase [Streptomyces venezuelae]
MSTILVTGGTGTLGRPLVERLRAGGHEVRVLSRSSREYPVDLLTGAGLEAALAGVEAVVHCASSPKGGDEKAAGHLIRAARAAGVGHLVYISIVGVDEVPLPYYRAKHRVERMIEESGLGWTVLRTTQFHDLVLGYFEAVAKLPVLLVPGGVRDQPIAVEEVADRLAGLAVAAPAGRVADMGGPEVLDMAAAARAYLKAAGRRRPVLGVRLPGKTFAAFRRGGHLTPAHAVGRGTFTEFLARRTGAAA